jgi:signal transduction histidine kinase
MSICIDPKFLTLIVHDLRAPLNAMLLTLRLLEKTLPDRNSQLDEDLRLMKVSVAQVERMLARVSEYGQMCQDGMTARPERFDLGRIVSEVLEGLAVGFELKQGAPAEAELDPGWARAALRAAVENALAAAEGAAVSATLGGGSGRLMVQVTAHKPPPPSVVPGQLLPDRIECLQPNAYERLGLDLALAARVSELFGGRASLEASPGQSSTIVLDWPVRL